MPVLNAASNLPISLPSLLQQRFQDFEIVLVDGGSLDQTVDLADVLLKGKSIAYRIVVFPGSSIYAAMNHGVHLAQGEWLYVLGSDDQLINDQVFERMSGDLVAADDAVLLVHGDVWIEDPGYRYGQPWDLPRLLDRNISHQSAFYRRRPLQMLGITYDERYQLYADWDYNLKVLSKGRFHYVPVLIASYACSGKSSGRVDPMFMAEKEGNARSYFGWRSLWMMPPHRFAVAIESQAGFVPRFQSILNRLIWSLRRLVRRNP